MVVPIASYPFPVHAWATPSNTCTNGDTFFPGNAIFGPNKYVWKCTVDPPGPEESLPQYPLKSAVIPNQVPAVMFPLVPTHSNSLSPGNAPCNSALASCTNRM